MEMKEVQSHIDVEVEDEKKSDTASKE